jgi:cell division protein FtsB
VSVSPHPLSRRILVLALSALVVVGLAVGANGLLRVWQMQRELAALEADIVRLNAQTQTLARTVERLRNDPVYIEKLAREDLGYVRKDDTVLKFPSQSSPR